jgi:uncharacterized membrane protein
MNSEARPRGTGPLAGSERGSGRLQRPSTPSTTEAAPPAPREKAPGITDTLRRLSHTEFNTAMIHLYRGEVTRANTWRNRLDTTTNWAVITAAASLSFSFGDPFAPHFVILINSLLVAFFLFMEARRYRYYEIWSSRVRVLETGYFAQMLERGGVIDEEWAEHLALDLLTPRFTISEWEAVGRRLRRNYLWIFALLAASWNLKVYLHPVPARDFQIFMDRATIGVVPGVAVFVIGIIFNLVVLVFAVATVRLRQATGEVLPHHHFSFSPFRRVKQWTNAATTRSRSAATLRRAKRARQRVRTTGSTATGEFKKPAPTDQEPVTEEPITR